MVNRGSWLIGVSWYGFVDGCGDDGGDSCGDDGSLIRDGTSTAALVQAFGS